MPSGRPARPRPRLACARADAAVSEVVGSVLLVALAVVMMGAFGGLVMANVTSETPTPPAATFTLEPRAGDAWLDVRLVSGSVLPFDATALVAQVEGRTAQAGLDIVEEPGARAWRPSQTLRVTLAQPLLEGERILFLAADSASGKSIGMAHATVPSAAAGGLAPIQRNALAATLDFSAKPLVADGVTQSYANVSVSSKLGLLLVDSVTVDLRPVGGERALRLSDEDGDGVFSGRFAVANYSFYALPAHRNVTLAATVRDLVGNVLEVERPLHLTTPQPPKVAAGIAYRNIGSSTLVGEQGFLNLTNFTFRNANELDNDLVILRVSDFANPALAWTASVSFAAAGSSGCAGPGVRQVELRLDTPDAAVRSLVYRPTSGCFAIGQQAILNLADLSRSWDESGVQPAWALDDALSTGTPEELLYFRAGIGTRNEAYVSFFGDTVSQSPLSIGLGQSDFGWSGRVVGDVVPPGAPTALLAMAANTAVQLSWTAPTSDGGAPITSYRIFMGTQPGALALHAEIGSGTSHTVAGLANGVTYHFAVYAVNAGGLVSEASAPASATPAAVPDQPVLAAVEGVRRVDLSWTPVAPNGAPLARYEIHRGLTPGSIAFLASVSSATTSYADLTAADATTYHYRVAAVNGIGSSFSDVASVTSPGVPSAPTGFAASEGDALVSLSWNAAAANGRDVTAYRVYRDGALVATITGLAYDATGLTNGVEYAFAVSASNAVGEGPQSAAVLATPALGATAPGTPQAFGVTPGNRTVSLAWAAPAGDGGSPVTEYEILRGGSLLTSVAPGVTSFQDSGLQNGVTHTYAVRAVNAVGTGSATGALAATPVTIPNPPILTSATPGNGTVALTWSAPVDNGGLPVTNYHVYRGAPGSGTLVGSTGTGAVTSLVASGLPNGVAQTFYVTATNANGTSNPSNARAATPYGAPFPPEDLVATGVLNGVSLAWGAPSDNGGSPILRYLVYRGSSPETMALLGETTGTTFSSAGLSPETTWHFRVVANTSVANSAPSNTASAMVLGHAYASATTTSLNGGAIANAANLARDNGGDVAMLSEGPVNVMSFFPASANDRHFNTTPNTWKLVSSSSVALSFPTTGGNPGGAMLVRSTSGTWSATVEVPFTLAAAATSPATFSVDAYTTGGGAITFLLVKPDLSTVTLGSTAAGTYTTVSATVAASDLAATGTYKLRVQISGSGNNKDTYVDNVVLGVPSASNHRFGHELTVGGITPGTSYQLQVRARTLANAEDLQIRSSAGTLLATVSGGSMTTYSVAITPSGGSYTLRLLDATTSSDLALSTWEIDYVRVVTS